MNEKDEPKRTLLTPIQFCERHAWCRMGGLRAWLFHRNSNGFSACVRQIGKKILIDEDEALAWIDRQQGGAA